MARSPSRRDDDRYRRDDRDYRRRSRDREVRRRSRSPPGRDLTRPQRRDYDRDYYHPRDRSRDRGYDGRRRDRSRDRKRSREGSPVRERRRERYRDDREYDDHDRKRPRRDDTPPRRRHRDDSRERMSTKSASVKGNNEVRHFSSLFCRTLLIRQSPRPTTADAVKDDLKAKQARVEAWKKKLQDKNSQKASTSSPAPAVTTEATASPLPAASSPSAHSHSGTGTEPGLPDVQDDKPASPAAYTGKFDPKVIAKRAAVAMEKSKAALGGDVVIPKSATETPHVIGSTVADSSKAAHPSCRTG